MASPKVAAALFANRPPSQGIEPADDKVSLLRTVKPYIAAAAVILTGTALIAAIFFTLLDLQWIAFLAGIVFASILAMTTRAARAETTAASSMERLALAEHRLEGETAQREKLEGLLAAANARLRYSDTSMPAMVAFIDRDTRYKYHNPALREWLGLRADQIDGQHVRDVLGRKLFAEIEDYVSEAAAGNIVRYERTHKDASGAPCLLAVQYLPQLGGDGKYAGFHMVSTDVTRHADEPPARAELPARTAQAVAEKPDSWKAASESILAAIDGNEFALLSQRILPLAQGSAADKAAPGHYEVLIRLLEEESGQIPPGAFFPLAEEHGLLPQLDRWVFSHIFDWMVTPVGAGTVRAGGIYFVNVAAATLSDQDFPEYVEAQLRRTGAAAASVCVEIAEADLIQHQGDAVQFARAMKDCGCRVAISGFGRDRATVDSLKLFPVDFLKIDGGIVRQIVKYPTFLGRAAAISRVAKTIGVRTIAEMVEDEATLDILRGLKVDFAQGFGISQPQLLEEMRPVD
jgi:PAS domain S-box-containing protein